MKAVFLLGLSAVVCGCSKSPPPPGAVTSVENACTVSDGTRVRLSGYLHYERGLLSFCSTFGGHKTCDLALYATGDKIAEYDVMHPRSGPEPAHAKLSVPVGSAPGEMVELPQKFSSEDIVLHLPNDARATEGSHVTIDGSVSVIPGAAKGPGACFVKVEWATP